MDSIRVFGNVAACILLLGLAASAQSNGLISCSTQVICAYRTQLQKAVDAAAAKNRLDDQLQTLLAVETFADLYIVAHAPQSAFNNFVNAWEQARVDKQAGPTASSSGATNLVSRPSTSELIALALQAGAFTEATNGSTATFNGNLDGMFRALVGVPVVCLDCGTLILKDINLAATFDLNRGGTQTVSTSGSATAAVTAPAMVLLPKSTRQLSVFTARYNLYNPLDPRSKQFRAGWAKALEAHRSELEKVASDLLASIHATLNNLVTNEAYSNLQKEYSDTLRADAEKGSLDKLTQDFTSYLAQVDQLVRDITPDFDNKVGLAMEALARYTALNYETVNQARGKSQATFEYNFSRPVMQPQTHDFRLIVGLHPFGGAGLLSLNGAATIYGEAIPAGAHYQRLRDFQFSGQFDRPLGDRLNHPATLTVAGYIQYRFDPTVIEIGPGNLIPGTNLTLAKDAKVLLGTKGTLAIAQAKITINGKSGVNIPIGVSWANRTDLLNATDVRGHIGITYDFDSVTQLFNGR